jgi:glutaredoxin
VFFADLTRRGEDGSYPVVALSRYNAAEAAAPTAGVAANTTEVIVYSAEWCGYCKKAMAWLGKKGIPFVEKDVEKDPGADRELKQKLKAAGMRAGGVPVIDVRGKLVVGFDRGRLQALLDPRPGEKEGLPKGPAKPTENAAEKKGEASQ